VAALQAASIRSTTVDDRERRQNDTWIAACALSIDAAIPVVTGNLRDFTALAGASNLTVVHPDL
jgi:predicted nucleic acid-binding protein